MPQLAVFQIDRMTPDYGAEELYSFHLRRERLVESDPLIRTGIRCGLNRHVRWEAVGNEVKQKAIEFMQRDPGSAHVAATDSRIVDYDHVTAIRTGEIPEQR